MAPSGMAVAGVEIAYGHVDDCVSTGDLHAFLVVDADVDGVVEDVPDHERSHSQSS